MRVVARWREGRASHKEVAALRRLLPELRNRPVAEVFREARASAEWVLAIGHTAHAQHLREQAERAGLVAVVEPVSAPDLTVVSDDEVVAELTAGRHAPTDFFLVAGLVCSVNVRGELMGLSIDDETLAAATKAYLRRAGAREYVSYQEFVADHRAGRTATD